MSNSRGFTLLEILIALVISSIGLLGIVGLQAAALNYQSNTYLRTIAMLQAEDIADRMRANMGGVTAGNYNVPASSGSEDLSCLGQTGAGKYNSNQSCDNASMADHDIFEWKANVASSLPNGAGVVCIDSTPSDGNPSAVACDNTGTDLYTVKIWWDEREANTTANADLSTHQLVITFQP